MCRVLLAVMLLMPACLQADVFNYAQADYIAIRGVERCVNKAGWDNEQVLNDRIISGILQQQGIPYDTVKLQRDAYWYEQKMPSSQRVDMDYDIAEAEQNCARQYDMAQWALKASRVDNSGVSISSDELLD